MRKLFVIKLLIIFTIIVNNSYSNKRVENINNKKIRNQIIYILNESTPFTGELIGQGVKEQYENGIRHGNFQGYVMDEDQKLIYEGKYINGIKHGAWMIKYPTGESKVVLKYNYDKPSGQWTYFYENKILEGHESLEDGILEGRVVKYSVSGELLTKLNYNYGLLNGEAVFFHKGEILETVTYFKYGKIDGGIKIFDKNANPILEGGYKIGKREGIWKFFYKTGDVKTVVNYLNGLKEGELIIYDKAGSIAQKTTFIKGNEIDSKGKVISENKEFKDSIVDRFKKFNRNLKYEKYDKILSEME
ncbi:toxin-antitoxin system YwqK family antitoxin [uncultured Cetobacterium sp.]|uniref:toxin-antitoxin system YwqK family antitoxin n=1 Tax=uncultured Cetobacterium sp. TaxID=527638 RepID=UPI002635161E|nr:toxin-antitoxin system YwqK family antitoxin [uncultured Cetobacterium sp.]